MGLFGGGGIGGFIKSPVSYLNPTTAFANIVSGGLADTVKGIAGLPFGNKGPGGTPVFNAGKFDQSKFLSKAPIPKVPMGNIQIAKNPSLQAGFDQYAGQLSGLNDKLKQNLIQK